MCISLLALPVPVDLRAMLTAICMEHGPRFAWLDCCSPAHSGADRRRRPRARFPLKGRERPELRALSLNEILIRPRPGVAQILKSQTN